MLWVVMRANRFEVSQEVVIACVAAAVRSLEGFSFTMPMCCSGTPRAPCAKIPGLVQKSDGRLHGERVLGAREKSWSLEALLSWQAEGGSCRFGGNALNSAAFDQGTQDLQESLVSAVRGSDLPRYPSLKPSAGVR